MSFNSLPSELQLLVISDGVRADSTSSLSSSSSYSSCRNFDTQQALKLCQVSHTCRNITTQLLYSTIRITKPASLKLLAATLADRPDLAQLITSLHLGPDSQLRLQGWPVTVGNVDGEWPWIYLHTTLGEGDEHLRPKWCKPGADFNIKRSQKSCSRYAVDRAIAAACVYLDVEPWRRAYGKSGRKIGYRAWAERLFMLQGALDLYLMELRRIEDERSYAVVSWRTPELSSTSRRDASAECKKGVCGHYPQLEVQSAFHFDWPDSEGEEDKVLPDETYTITSDQLWRHIARRNGPVNHFDHLLLYTGSRRETFEVIDEEWLRIKAALGGPHYSLFTNEEWESMYGPDKAAEARRKERLRLRREERAEERRQERLQVRKAEREERARVREGEAQARAEYGGDEEEDDDEEGSSDADEDDKGSSEIEEDEDDGDGYDDYDYDDDEEDWDYDDDAASFAADSEEHEWMYECPRDVVAKVGDLVKLGRRILAATTSLKNLSLTGFMHRSLTTLHSPQKLLCLNLGPLPAYWTDNLPEATRLTGLKKLRVCGRMSSADALRIAVSLPSLERMRWEMAEDRCSLKSAHDVIRCLQELTSEAEEGKSEHSRKRRRDDEGEDEPAGSAAGSGSPSVSVSAPSNRSTEVWLHPKELPAIMALAPSRERREAWASGELAPGALYRVKVMESSAAVMSHPGRQSDEDKTVANEFEIARMWWEEGLPGPSVGE